MTRVGRSARKASARKSAAMAGDGDHPDKGKPVERSVGGSHDEDRDFSDNDFRIALSRFPSGVTVVTTGSKHDAVGYTATAFASVSLRPPLVLTCLQETADCYQKFQEATRFGISILSTGQRDIATKFATKGIDKFLGTPLAGGRYDVPLIAGAAAQLECEVWAIYEGGDHAIIVGLVRSALTTGKEPLIYLERAFGKFGANES